MFTIREVRTERGTFQYRRESLTGIRCRISPVRVERKIDTVPALPLSREGCPFCPDSIGVATPTFEDGSRLRYGESVTFPNLYPYAERHIVTVITPDHATGRFGVRCLADALSGAAEALSRSPGYASINWNYLPSAGASIVHPHLQGIADTEPTFLAGLYIAAARRSRIQDIASGREDSFATTLACWTAVTFCISERLAAELSRSTITIGTRVATSPE